MPIITGQTAQASDFIDTSSGAGDQGKVPKLNSSGRIDNSCLPVKFGGNGSDGVLSISSGTTTISAGGASILVKNYSSVSITGTAKLVFNSPGGNGTFIVLKSQGNVTISSSSVPAIDVSGMGAGSGTQGLTNFLVMTNPGYGGISSGSLPANAVAVTSANSIISPFYKIPILACGAGGGYGNGGASNGQTFSGGGGGASLINSGGSAGTRGANNGWGGSGAYGGNGGGVLLIEVGGTYTCSSTLYSRGSVGQQAPLYNNNQASGGGGAGGCLGIIYNVLGSDTGTYDTSGGAGGAANGSQSAAGGTGATGYSFRYLNTEIA